MPIIAVIKYVLSFRPEWFVLIIIIIPFYKRLFKFLFWFISYILYNINRRIDFFLSFKRMKNWVIRYIYEDRDLEDDDYPRRRFYD